MSDTMIDQSNTPPPPRPPRLGELLREARERRGLELGDVAEVTHVRKEYLRALDEGRYDDLPEDIYTRNFVRLYGQAVGLDGSKLLEHYSRERRPTHEVEASATPPRPSPKRPQRQPAGNIVTTLLILVLVGVLVGVAVWAFNTFLFTPRSPLNPPAASTEPGEETAPSQGGSEVENASLPAPGARVGDTVFLTLSSVPSGAEVSLDNYDFPGTTPLERVPVTPGKNRLLRVSLEGFETYEAALDLTTDRDLVVPLTPLPAVGGSAFSGFPGGALTLTVEATSWLEVYEGTARGQGKALVYREVEPGETFRFEPPVYLHVGNAGGIRYALEGQDQGMLGENGEVLSRAFGE